MLAAMLYIVAMGVAISALAWAAERLIASRGGARRFVWIAALVASALVPAAMFSSSPTSRMVEEPRVSTAGSETGLASGGTVSGATLPATSSTKRMFGAWPSRPELDRFLGWAWGALSAGMFLWILSASWLLRKKSRHWPVETVDGHVVRISQSTGPAVCGVFSRSIVIPQWVATAQKPVRELILLHEQSHLRANDSLLFWIGLLLVVVAPWNAPLWWQLHRLRFAIEVDCDSRVLRDTDQDAVAYGETLLAVGQRISEVPTGAIALNESNTQLERRIRIMIFEKPQFSGLATGALVLLACASIAGAASLSVPPLVSSDKPGLAGDKQLLIPPPKWLDLRWPEIDASLQSLLVRQYPKLLAYDGDEIPLVEVLFTPSGDIERSELRMLASVTELNYSNVLFEKSGSKTEELAYVQPRDIQPPTPAKRVHFFFGERTSPTNTYAYAKSLGDISGDLTAQDRLVLDRQFPDAARGRVTSDPILWIVLDRDGRVIRSGREPSSEKFHNSIGMQERINALFPEIRTNEVRVSSIHGNDGKQVEDANGDPVFLYYFWLDQGSPMPGSWARQ